MRGLGPGGPGSAESGGGRPSGLGGGSAGSEDVRGPADRGRLLKELAREEGFDRVGICRPEPSEHGAFLARWLEAGFHGTMGYLADPEAVVRRNDPVRSLSEARSVLVVGHEYYQRDPEGATEDPGRGIVARYARGRDYHRVVKKGLQRVHRRFEEALGTPVAGRAYVDTGPLLERELGMRAGLGWFGRNTMLIDPRRGSWFFLGALLLGVEAEPDPPFERDHCGSCRACLDACPTGALLGRDQDGAPVMDATRCISYLTIENRGPIPRELRPLIGNRIYGCDICQEVCPFNVGFAEEAVEPGYAARGPGERPAGVEAVGTAGKATAADEVAAALADAEADASEEASAARTPQHVSDETPSGVSPHPGTDAPSLVALLEMALDPDAWEAFSRGSAIRRAGRAGFARNACVALGNWGSPEVLAVLARALADPEPLVRGHAAWALGQVGGEAASALLTAAASSETDAWVAAEVEGAVASGSLGPGRGPEEGPPR